MHSKPSPPKAAIAKSLLLLTPLVFVLTLSCLGGSSGGGVDSGSGSGGNGGGDSGASGGFSGGGSESTNWALEVLTPDPYNSWMELADSDWSANGDIVYVINTYSGGAEAEDGITKISPVGTPEWALSFDGLWKPSRVAIGSDGGIFVSGYDGIFGNSYGGHEYMLHFKANGDFDWGLKFDAPPTETWINDVTTGADGSAIVIFYQLDEVEGYQARLSKFSSDGSVVWTTSCEGMEGSMAGTYWHLDPGLSGSCFVLGEIFDEFTWTTSPCIASVSTHGTVDWETYIEGPHPSVSGYVQGVCALSGSGDAVALIDWDDADLSLITRHDAVTGELIWAKSLVSPTYDYVGVDRIQAIGDGFGISGFFEKEIGPDNEDVDPFFATFSSDGSPLIVSGFDTESEGPNVALSAPQLSESGYRTSGVLEDQGQHLFNFVFDSSGNATLSTCGDSKDFSSDLVVQDVAVSCTNDPNPNVASLPSPDLLGHTPDIFPGTLPLTEDLCSSADL